MSAYVPDASALRLRWTASSYSGGGNNCVEVAWTVSSYSGGNNNCVEAGRCGPAAVAVRDSKRPAGPALVVPADAWAAFIADLR